MQRTNAITIACVRMITGRIHPILKGLDSGFRHDFKNHRQGVRSFAGDIMLSTTQSDATGLSMEAVPAGRAMPEWLVDALIDGRRLMVIHPTEESRRQAIKLLHSQKGGGVIDTTHHLTLIRLIRIIHLDLRLPVLLEDDGVLFELCHNALITAASDPGPTTVLVLTVESY